MAKRDVQLPAVGFDVVRTLRFRRAADAAPAARAALEGLDLGVDRDLMDDIRLLVSEVVASAVRHSTPGTPGWVRLRLTVLPYGIRVELGSPGQRSLFTSTESALAMEDGPGFGLYLIDRLADRWGLRRAGDTHLWFEVDRDPSKPLAATSG